MTISVTASDAWLILLNCTNSDLLDEGKTSLPTYTSTNKRCDMYIDKYIYIYIYIQNIRMYEYTYIHTV